MFIAVVKVWLQSDLVRSEWRPYGKRKSGEWPVSREGSM